MVFLGLQGEQQESLVGVEGGKLMRSQSRHWAKRQRLTRAEPDKAVALHV